MKLSLSYSAYAVILGGRINGTSDGAFDEFGRLRFDDVSTPESADHCLGAVFPAFDNVTLDPELDIDVELVFFSLSLLLLDCFPLFLALLARLFGAE